MVSGEPPLAPAQYPEDAPASGAGRGDSFLVWFLPPCWLMLKAACLSLIRSVEGLTPARLTASLSPGKRATEILLQSHPAQQPQYKQETALRAGVARREQGN